MFIRQLCAIFLLAFCATGAVAVPAAMTYQGKLTDSLGQPLPDGQHSVSFSFFSQPTGSQGFLWSHGPVQVTTSGGMFTTQIPLNLGVIAGNDAIWLEANVNGQALLPRVALTSTPFAVKSAVTATVPDGSITKEKLSDGIPFTRAPFATGVTSGLPAGSRLVVIINGTPTEPEARLGAPYSINNEVVESTILDPQGNPRIVKLPGRLSWSGLTLQRTLSKDKTWLQWGLSTFGTTQRKNVSFVLYGSDNQVISEWNGAAAWVSKYNIKLVDDGLAVEEIQLEFDMGDFPVPEQRKYVPAIPAGVPVQTGLLSGLHPTAAYRVSIDDQLFPEYRVVSDVLFGFDVIEQRIIGPGGEVIQKIPGRSRTPEFSLLRAAGSANMLLSWRRAIIDGTVQRKSMAISVGSPSFVPRLLLENAWPSGYKLFLADDGLPVEEYRITYETPALP